jgi:hypothetical protein
MHKNATKCNKTQSKWCINKHGASKIIDTFETYHLPPLENCYLDVPLADIARKKPLGRIHDVLIMVNNNFVPVDFFILDIECNASCSIILGRPFLGTVGAIIDMKEGTIRYQFPLKKVWNTFLER